MLDHSEQLDDVGMVELPHDGRLLQQPDLVLLRRLLNQLLHRHVILRAAPCPRAFTDDGERPFAYLLLDSEISKRKKRKRKNKERMLINTCIVLAQFSTSTKLNTGFCRILSTKSRSISIHGISSPCLNISMYGSDVVSGDTIATCSNHF